MAIFKKINSGGSGYFLDSIADKEHTSSMFVNVTDNRFEIKITKHYANSETEIALWHVITLDKLQNLNSVCDNSVWSSSISDNTNHTDDAPCSIEDRSLIDLFSETLVSKGKVSLESSHRFCPYVIYVNDKNGTFNDFTIGLRIPDSELTYTIEGPHSVEINAAERIEFLKELLPEITLTSATASVSPDSSVDVTVTTDSSVREVYLEQVYGVLNKTRVNISNGVGMFKILSTGFTAGEELRVKAGHRKFTGLTDIVIPVV